MANTRDYEQALRKLRSALTEAQSNPNFRSIISHQDIVLARYHPAFQFDTIQQLSEETFRSFLYFENNHHWSGLNRKSLILCENMPVLRSTLATLLNPTLPLVGRWNKSVRNLLGVGRALATAILLISSPNEFGVWNTTSERALRVLNIWPDFPRGSLGGEKYAIINQLLNDLATDLGIDLWTLDALMWNIKSSNAGIVGRDTAPDDSVGTVSQTKKNIQIPVAMSFETIANSLKTIKEYRDYYDPEGTGWAEYIYELFHVLGFGTEKIDSRLFFLRDIGSMTPRVLVLCNFPKEDNILIAPGISWESYLRFAASYLQVKWGILTNGLSLQVFRYGTSEDSKELSWPDLDTVIRDQNVERFFPIYKTLSFFESPNIELPKSDASRHDLRLQFWKELIDQTKPVLPRFSKITPGKNHWISVGAGKSGLSYSFVVRMNDAQVELYIDQADAKKNKRLFDTLHARREQIENAFGKVLHWERLNDKRASRVSYLIGSSGLLARNSWSELQKQLIQAMVQFQKAINPEIDKLK